MGDRYAKNKEGKEEVKIDLGSGPVKGEDGWTTVDIHSGADVRHNLNYRWPWKNDSVDEIKMMSCLEHLDDYRKAILEMYRVLKPGGIVTISVPHVRGHGAFLWEHTNYFEWLTFHELTIDQPLTACSKPAMFDEISFGFVLWRRPRKVIDWLVSLRPSLWEKFGWPQPDGIIWRAKKKLCN